jgi:phosphoglycerol transferase
VAAGALAAIIGGTFLICSYPSINYWRVYGQNQSAANRGVAESESYGLKLWTLVTPPPDHRVTALGKIGQPIIKDARVGTEQGANLDLLATAGFFGALYGGLASGMLKRKGAIDIRGPDDRDVIRETGSIVILVSVLFGVIGGFSVLVSRFGFQEVRVWDRMAVFIALFSLFIVASWAERLDAWLRQRPRANLLRFGLVAIMVVFALGDTIQLHVDYPAYRKAWAIDDHFVHAIERKVPAGTAIFQLPVLPFPEAVPPGTMQDYDPLRGYLHDDGKLYWSYGIIKGRPQADWQTYLRDHTGPIGAMPALLGMGFTGLWVDTHGYTDGGKEVRQIQQLVKVKPLRSSDGRFLFYDLRPYKKRLGLSDAQLRAEAQRDLHITPPVPPR